MTQEEEKLVLIDLCGRLPYGVKCCYDILSGEIKIDTLICINKVIIGQDNYWDIYFENCDEDIPLETVKPYLRPLSSMSEEERKEYNYLYYQVPIQRSGGNAYRDTKMVEALHIDWLNKNMFDHRGLIPKGLALEAPKDMYNN